MTATHAGPSACELSITNPHRVDTPRTEASTARPELVDPSCCHSEMQALLDADMSDDDIPDYCGNNAANQPITGNGLDQVVFSFQRQFILSSPRRQNWPWNTSVAGVGSAESHSAATPQTMFHEGSSSRGRHLSSGSAKIAGMPLTDDSMLVSPVCRGETNLKTCDSTSDGSDMRGLLSTEDLFGTVSVCNMTESETCETANRPCSARPKTTQLHDPREHCQISPPNMHTLPSTSRVTDDKPNTDGEQCDDDTCATFHGDIECVDVFPWTSDVSQNLWTEFDETKSESELTNSTGSTSSLHFSDVFMDLRANETLLDCDSNVLHNDKIDSHNNTSTVHEDLTHDWNDACTAGLSRGSDSDTELDRSTDTIETYMTGDSASLEQIARASTTSEDSVSLASDLGHLFACEHDSDIMSSNNTDSDNVSVLDGSMIDRSASLISLQSGTTNSDSLVNDNTRNLFLMTDNAIRLPVRCSRRQNSPMGSVNSDSLINGQNRDLFTQSNADDYTNQTGNDLEQIQSDIVHNESDSGADDWYVYDERLTAELNSLRRLIDMRNYVRTQQHWETQGIIGPPPYEECPEAGGDAVTIPVAEIPDNPPPPYTEHTESLPPEYDQLSDHGVTAEDVHQRSSLNHQNHRGISCNSESEMPTSDSNHVGDGNNELDNDHIVGCQTDNTSSDEHADSSRELDLETVDRRQGNDPDWSATRMPSPGCNPPSYRRSLYSLGHHLPLRWNTVAGVNQWASSRLWASSRMPS